MRYRLRHGGNVHEVEVAALGAGSFRVSVDGAIFELRAELRGPALDLVTPEGLVRAWISRDGSRRFVTAPGIGEAVLERIEGRQRARGEQSGPELASPMPGKIVKVLVSAGDRVTRGQALVVVEAMKTELSIAATAAGTVKAVRARVGEKCDAGQTLVEVEGEAEGEGESTEGNLAPAVSPGPIAP